MTDEKDIEKYKVNWNVFYCILNQHMQTMSKHLLTEGIYFVMYKFNVPESLYCKIETKLDLSLFFICSIIISLNQLN